MTLTRVLERRGNARDHTAAKNRQRDSGWKLTSKRKIHQREDDRDILAALSRLVATEVSAPGIHA